MRYLFGFLYVCALVGTSPLSASAQAGEEGATSEPNLQEPAPSAEPAPEEPALQLELDSAGLAIAPNPLRTVDGYTLEEMELRVRRARIGVGVSGVAVGLGLTAAMVAAAGSICISFGEPCSPPSWVAPTMAVGVLVAAGGLATMIVYGAALGRRKRDRDSLRAAHYGRPHRVQWDLAQSRLVF